MGFISFTISIIIAKLSYAWLEKPFLKLKDRFAVVKTQLA
jgi:peptidoglycan/LPS O-acetylase OafA/YrhL